FKGTRCLLTLHNLAYQGIFPADWFSWIGIPLSEFTNFEYYGQINLLKAGIIYADVVNTISPNYAQEILTPNYGFGLEEILRKKGGKKGVIGIINGIDQGIWSPETAEGIRNYGREDVRAGKLENKGRIIERFRFQLNSIDPLIFMISRPDWQKGIVFAVAAMRNVLGQTNSGFIFHSNDFYPGEYAAQMGKLLGELAGDFPGRVAILTPFDEGLSVLLYAGGDIGLYPPRYEPCGLDQMKALRFGAVAVVRAVGGLEYTVIDFGPDFDKGNGIVFSTRPLPLKEETDAYFSDSVEGLQAATMRAIGGWRNPDTRERMIVRAMSSDFSWGPSVSLYQRLYRGEQVSSSPASSPDNTYPLRIKMNLYDDGVFLRFNNDYLYGIPRIYVNAALCREDVGVYAIPIEGDQTEGTLVEDIWQRWIILNAFVFLFEYAYNNLLHSIREWSGQISATYSAERVVVRDWTDAEFSVNSQTGAVDSQGLPDQAIWVIQFLAILPLIFDAGMRSSTLAIMDDVRTEYVDRGTFSLNEMIRRLVQVQFSVASSPIKNNSSSPASPNPHHHSRGALRILGGWLNPDEAQVKRRKIGQCIAGGEARSLFAASPVRTNRNNNHILSFFIRKKGLDRPRVFCEGSIEEVISQMPPKRLRPAAREVFTTKFKNIYGRVYKEMKSTYPVLEEAIAPQIKIRIVSGTDATFQVELDTSTIILDIICFESAYLLEWELREALSRFAGHLVQSEYLSEEKRAYGVLVELNEKLNILSDEYLTIPDRYKAALLSEQAEAIGVLIRHGALDAVDLIAGSIFQSHKEELADQLGHLRGLFSRREESEFIARLSTYLNLAALHDKSIADIQKGMQDWLKTEEKKLSGRYGRGPWHGINKQKILLARVLESPQEPPEGRYYDLLVVVVDKASERETERLIARARGRYIAAQADVLIVSQPTGKIKGNWSAVINLIINYSGRLQGKRSIAVILSAGTGSRNCPLTVAGFGDKGKQPGLNGEPFLYQIFKQIMHYYPQVEETGGMVITTNDGIKAISQDVVLGEYPIEMLGACLPVANRELDELGTAKVDWKADTFAKPIEKMNEKLDLSARLKEYEGEELIPTNWADYFIRKDMIPLIKDFYSRLRDEDGTFLHEKYGFD
ncbi:MAG: glycogen/starch synthase, partial [Candidatus Omnitrophica bacterium]|nr:glycogen/starch synthase [Candidatus Omnitrophota bacterium]